MGRPRINEVGNTYGRLYVEEEVKERTKRGAVLFKCKCECGNEKIVTGGDLRTGRVNSCGCYKSEYITDKNTSHGQKYNRIYRTYYNMINRCYKENNKHYHNYGGRGISVCDEWLIKEIGFVNFYNWSMENGYSDDLTIDRIDFNGNYEPSNCRWATQLEQANNRVYEIKGLLLNISQWSKLYGVDYKKLIYIVNKTNSIEDSLLKLGVDVNNE